MGLDFRTQGREGLPVYAAADGYIGRIKIEPGGFGNAIYIYHPNGYTTLYAHLSRFQPFLAAWVKQKQYAAESWKIYLEPDPALFPVKKGELIGYSGNTGGSQAPHLHFEIRDREDQTYNPLYFGFPLPDHIAPQITRLAVYDRRRSTYLQQPRLLPLAGNKEGVVLLSSPLVSFAISSVDRHDGSTNPNGIAGASLWMDDSLRISFRFEKLGYEATRYLNAHIDYRFKTEIGGWLQHLSELPGYTRNSIYTHNGKSGVLDISDGKPHRIRIKVFDTENNQTETYLAVQWDGKASDFLPVEGMAMPRSLTAYEKEEAEFYIGENSLYDACYIRYSRATCEWEGAVSSLHTIGEPNLPLQDSILIRIKPFRELTEQEKAHTLMRWQQGGKMAVQKLSWQKGWASAKTRDFGTFALVIDTIPPVIVPVGFIDQKSIAGKSKLVFWARDNQGKITQVRTELDGKWIRFSNDKSLSFVYDMDEHFGSGWHELTITATDEAGNTTRKSFHLSR